MKYLLNILIIALLAGCTANRTVSLQSDTSQKPDTSNLVSINYFSLGEAAVLEKDLGSAIILFKKADAADPQNLHIKERLLETLAIVSYQNTSDRTEILNLSATYYEQGTYTPRMLFIMADAFRLEKRFSEADKMFKKGLKLEPSMHSYLYYYQFRVKAYPPADTKILDKALKLPWKNMGDVLAIGELYSLENADKGLEILSDAYERWDDETSLATLLTAYDKKGERNKILELIRNRIDNHKSVKDQVKAFLITRYFADKNYDEVLELRYECYNIGTENVLKALFFSAINLNEYVIGIEAGLALEELDTIPAEMKVSFNSYLAKLYFDSGETDKTLEYLLRTDNLKSVTNLIFQYDFENDDEILEKLLLLLEEYRIASKNEDEISYLLALIYSQNDEKEKSIKAIKAVEQSYLLENKLLLPAATIYLQNAADLETARKLIELETDLEFTSNEIISSILYGTDYDSLAFVVCLQELEENEHPHVATFLRYSFLADRFHNVDDIIKISKRSLEMYQDNLDLMNAVGYMIADLQIEDEYELSRKLLEKAVIQLPDNVMVWDSLAWIYFRLGLYKPALDAMELPLSQGIDNSEIAYHLGEIYFKLNKTKKAKEYLHLAVEIADDEDSMKLAKELLEEKF